MKERLGQQIVIVSTKWDGTPRETYEGRLLDVTGPLIRIQVAAGTPVDRGTDRPAVGAVDAIELYFTDRWYNVLHFREHGAHRYLWYANIAMPARLDGATLSWIDLDIDVCCHVDGSVQTLDYDEFQENRSKLSYPDELVEGTLAAHAEVAQLGAVGAFPFDRMAQLGHWTGLT